MTQKQERLLLQHDAKALMREVSVLDRRVIYWEYNSNVSGQRPTLVMLHGFRGNSRGLASTAKLLRDFHIIVPDRPGYGLSQSLDTKHTLVNYADWLDKFVSTVRLQSFATWGHSYGGTIALIHAAQGNHKPTAVVTVSLATLRGGPLRWLTSSYYQLGRIMPTRLRRVWLTNRLIENSTGRVLFRTIHGSQRRAFFAERNRDLPSLRLDVITEEYLSGLEVDLTSYVRQVVIPVLFLGGGRDIVVPEHQLATIASQAPAGKVSIIPEQGHMAPLETPRLTAEYTADFLNGCFAVGSD